MKEDTRIIFSQLSTLHFLSDSDPKVYCMIYTAAGKLFTQGILILNSWY